MSQEEIQKYVEDISSFDAPKLRHQLLQTRFSLSPVAADAYLNPPAVVEDEVHDISCSPPMKKQRVATIEKVAKPPRVKKEKRQLDWEVVPRRHIALKFCYYGEKYAGLAIQEHVHTVEAELMKALVRTCLIPSAEMCNYARCGRTDKGVSALTQVCTIDVRSMSLYNPDKENELGVIPPYTSMEQYVRQMAIMTNQPVPEEMTLEAMGLFQASNTVHQIHSESKTMPSEYKESEATEYTPIDKVNSDVEEMDYISILNSVLPDDIRALAWAPVHPFYNSRFDCDARSYKYFFYQDGMNLQKMELAAKLQRGTHDFRNFCKMDVVQTRHFIRRVCDASVRVCGQAEYNETVNNNQIVVYDGNKEIPITYLNTSTVTDDVLCEFTVVGQAFLYHQVRCMIAVLFLVGQGLEEPEIVSSLFDLTQFERKPVYPIASDAPLILWDTSFPDCQWRTSRDGLQKAFSALHTQWRQMRMKTIVQESFWRSLLPTCLYLLKEHPEMPGTVPEQRYAPSLTHVLPRNHNKPLHAVTTTFPPVPTAFYSVLRIHGFLGVQLVPGKIPKNKKPVHVPTQEGIAYNPRGDEVPSLFISHSEQISHTLFEKRHCEPSFDSRVARLTGRKKDQHEKIQAFNEALVSSNIIKQVE